jgi:hypothetical protein
MPRGLAVPPSGTISPGGVPRQVRKLLNRNSPDERLPGYPDGRGVRWKDFRVRCDCERVSGLLRNPPSQSAVVLCVAVADYIRPTTTAAFHREAMGTAARSGIVAGVCKPMKVPPCPKWMT